MRLLVNLILEERKEALLAVGLGAVSGLTAVALFAQSGYMISKAALAPPFYTILILTAFLKLFGAVKSSSKYFERLISHRVTFSALSRIRQYFFERLDPLVPQVFTKYRSGDLLTRFVGDVEVLQNFFLRVLYPPLVTALVFLATVFFTVFFSVWLSLALVIGFILVAVVVPAASARSLQKHNVLSKRAHLATESVEYLNGYRDLLLHNQLEEQQNRLEEAQHSYINEQVAVGKTQLWSQTLNATVASFTALVMLGIGAYMVSAGQLDGLFLAMLTLVALTSFETAVPLAGLPGHLHESRQALDRLTTQMEQPLPVLEQELIPAAQYAIELSDVSYQYPDAIRPTLDSIKLRIPAGEKWAIVGASGSGKSTLLQLLAAMAYPTSGEVLYNTQTTKQLIPETVWKQLGVQLQGSHFFYGTIRDNLVIAKPNASDKELLHALEQAQFTSELDAVVYERGDNLSGGEKQRLALARLFLLDVPVWLLDEPFTSLDYATEQRLLYALQQHIKDGTVVLVSHKLSGLENMDGIVVMDHGKLVEFGSFTQLIENRAAFYEMYQIEKSLIE